VDERLFAEIVYFVNNHLFVRFLNGNALSKQFESLQLVAGSFNCRPEAVSSHFPYHTIVPLASENSRIKPFGLCFGILLHGNLRSQSDFKPAAPPMVARVRIHCPR